MAQNRKNGKIDFLKFIFAIVIVLHHGSQKVLGLKAGYFIGGSLAVEFFFIVSGYLLMASISRMSERTLPVGVETGQFLLRKFKGFYPELGAAFVLVFILEMAVQEKTIIQMWQISYPNVFLLDMVGIGDHSTHAELWYLSSMLLCMAVLFPLVRKHPHIMTNVVLPLVALLILGYFFKGDKHPRNPLKWLGWTYKGNLRALAEISLGICLYPIAQKLKQIQFPVLARIFLTLLEWFLYIRFIRYMYQETASTLDFYYLFVCAIAILLSFSQCGIDADWFQGRFFSFLGKASFALYLSHNCWAKNINTFLPEDFSKKERFAAYLAASAISTLAVMITSWIIQKLGNAHKKTAKKLHKEVEQSIS